MYRQCKSRDFQSGEDLSRGLLGCDAI